MITLKLEKQYQVPTRWNEFSRKDSEKFVSVCSALRDFERGDLGFDALKTRIALALCGVRHVRSITPQMEENIFRISELTDFPYTLKTGEDGKRYAYVNVVLNRNLICFRDWQGYRFDVSEGGLVDCDITAEQYIDCLQLVDAYGRSWDKAVLEKLFRTLYRPQSEGTDVPQEEILVAVYYNIRGILEWVKGLEAYRIVFTRGSSENAMPQSPLGMGASLFSLSKAGYGDIESIRRLDMFTYLGALVQSTVDSILAMKASKAKLGETAEKLNLPVDFVSQYF